MGLQISNSMGLKTNSVFFFKSIRPNIYQPQYPILIPIPIIQTHPKIFNLKQIL